MVLETDLPKQFPICTSEFVICYYQNDKICILLTISCLFHFSEPFDSKPFLGAALAAVRGKTELMDLVRVENRSQVC